MAGKKKASKKKASKKIETQESVQQSLKGHREYARNQAAEFAKKFPR